MIPFVKKMFSLKKSNTAANTIEELEEKKKKLEDVLDSLHHIENELRQSKKNR